MQNNTFSPLIVGQNVVHLKSVDSTNNYLKIRLAKSAPLLEGTVIMAEEQFAGRGQAANTWHSNPGENLTASVLLRPEFLRPDSQFKLNMAISLAVYDTVKAIVGFNLKIKWPNDIYFNDKKIGGILIENILQGPKWKHSIVGIGLNVNQVTFPSEIAKVSSIKQITGTSKDLMELLNELCLAMQFRYNQLLAGEDLMSEYLSRLFRFNEPGAYLIEGLPESGIIRGVGETGCLHVEINGEIRAFNIKDIAFVL